MGIHVWCVCTKTIASLHAEGFNVFDGEALEYLFDACALTPMPPSKQGVSMFMKLKHWNISLMLVH